MNPNRIEGVGAFNNARHFALVNVYGLDQTPRLVVVVGGSRGKRREVADVEVQMRPEDLAAVSLGQQCFKVGFLLQLFDRDLPRLPAWSFTRALLLS